jgi:hypothetical protein
MARSYASNDLNLINTPSDNTNKGEAWRFKHQLQILHF